MRQNQIKSSNPKSSGNVKASDKGQNNNTTDVPLDRIVEDLSDYLKKFSHFEKYEKKMKKQYKDKHNNMPDYWPVEFINEVWRKTKNMYTFSGKRKCWSLAILLQVMKRSQGYNESKIEAAQSDLKEDDQQSGEDEYICIPFLEMINDKDCSGSVTHKKNETPDTDAMEILENKAFKLIDKAPSPTQILQNKFYITLYDNRTRNAAWVYEVLNKNTISEDKNINKITNFKVDPSVYADFQAPEGKNPFKNKKYDRGHLAAAANHNWCQEAYEDTYFMSNMTPQATNFNRGKWKKLEQLCRKIADEKEVCNVHVYTGPLYLPRDRGVKDNNICEIGAEKADHKNQSNEHVEYEIEGGKAVPTHFFKVIIVENKDGKVLEPECYRMPNKESKNANEKNKGKTKKKRIAIGIEDYRTTLIQYNVKIEDIQKDSGLIFKEMKIRKEMTDGTWCMQWSGAQKNLEAQKHIAKIVVRISS